MIDLFGKKALRQDADIKDEIIESQANALDIASAAQDNYKRIKLEMVAFKKIYEDKLCKQKKHITKLIAKNKELKKELDKWKHTNQASYQQKSAVKY